jgi:hypothetical protein
LGVGIKTLNNVGGLGDPSNANLYLYFSGSELHIVKNGVSVYSVPGVSGKGDGGKGGGYDPIPSGSYSIRPGEIQEMSGVDALIGTLVNPVTQFLFNEKSGGWPGGPMSWGVMRAWVYELDGSDNGRGFSIHGGFYPGSAGCIDLTNYANQFFFQLRDYSPPASIPLIVNYGR